MLLSWKVDSEASEGHSLLGTLSSLISFLLTDKLKDDFVVQAACTTPKWIIMMAFTCNTMIEIMFNRGGCRTSRHHYCSSTACSCKSSSTSNRQTRATSTYCSFTSTLRTAGSWPHWRRSHWRNHKTGLAFRWHWTWAIQTGLAGLCQTWQPCFHPKKTRLEPLGSRAVHQKQPSWRWHQPWFHWRFRRRRPRLISQLIWSVTNKQHYVWFTTFIGNAGVRHSAMMLECAYMRMAPTVVYYTKMWNAQQVALLLSIGICH